MLNGTQLGALGNSAGDAPHHGGCSLDGSGHEVPQCLQAWRHRVLLEVAYVNPELASC